MLPARRIAPLFPPPGLHRLDHRGMTGCGGLVIEVDHNFTESKWVASVRSDTVMAKRNSVAGERKLVETAAGPVNSTLEANQFVRNHAAVR